MSIFKNLSNQEKKRLIKELDRKPNGIGYNEKVATNIHWLIWLNNDYHLTEEEREKMQFPKVESIVEVRMKEVEGISREKVEKVLTINRVLNNEKFPAVKISDYYYNAHYIKLGFALMDKNKEVKFMVSDSDYIREKKEKGEPIFSALTMTDGEISIMIMPLRLDVSSAFDREKVIDPDDSISLEDVQKARKYKLHLSKSHDPEHTNFSEKNILVSRGEYFVTIPKSNKFLREVFDCESDKPEDYSDGDILLEIDENQTKHTEDLFHKKVAYAKAVQGYGRDGEFYHLYENGTGVCFNAE